MNNSIPNVTTNDATGFDFRTKFQKLLGDNTSDKLAILECFQRFCQKSTETARKLLWNLTFSEDLTYSFTKLGITPSRIPDQDIPTFRNELRYQYQKHHPDFLEVAIPDDCREAFNLLLSHTDSVTADIVCNQILSKLYSDVDGLQRTLFLLESDKENRFFGGICDIGFSKEEASYLKQFHKEIYGLFKSLYEHHIPNISTSINNQPFSGLGEHLKEFGFQYPIEQDTANIDSTPEIAVKSEEFNSITQQEVQNETHQPEVHEYVEEVSTSIPSCISHNTNGYTPLTAQGILEHSEDFTLLLSSPEIMAILQQLHTCGFDLNEVVIKGKKINNLLKSANDLSL